MIPFFSHTGTKRNMAAARDAGWGLLLSAAGASWHHEDFPIVGADNGQWAERDNPGPFKADRFLRFVDVVGERPLWLVLPDIVCGGLASLDLSLIWLDRLRGHPSVLLIAVQDGMTPKMIAPFVGPRVGIFVGGSDDWKEPSIEGWGDLSAEAGCYLHVGRVNTARRMFLCIAAEAESCDGTSVTKYVKTLPMLDQASRHQDFASKWRQVSDRTPKGFARRCREIAAAMPGHQGHRALDQLSNDVLRDMGYSEGVDTFENAVAEWHAAGQPYPRIAA